MLLSTIGRGGEGGGGGRGSISLVHTKEEEGVRNFF